MTFSDPLLALKEFTLNHSDYQLILTDIRMPAISGMELAKKAKEVDADVRIVIMTAFELNAYELAQDLPFVKAEDLMKKPIMLSNICKVIDRKVPS
jgi:YesN/AraC family two-component response regulator